MDLMLSSDQEAIQASVRSFLENELPMARVRETWVFRYLLGFASTIAAGSKDIQRNIIGDRVLGLPR